MTVIIVDPRTFTETCRLTCSRPSRVRWIVTHLLGWAPLVVIAVIKESSSSFFSFSFFTRLSIARLEKLSLSPPCRWHIKLCTMLRQASLLVGVFVIDILDVCWFVGSHNRIAKEFTMYQFITLVSLSRVSQLDSCPSGVSIIIHWTSTSDRQLQEWEYGSNSI